MAAIGEDAKSIQDWLIGDLLALNLLHYTKQLLAIIHGALYERDTEERVHKIELYWLEKELQLKQFVPRSSYMKGIFKEISSGIKKNECDAQTIFLCF